VLIEHPDTCDAGRASEPCGGRAVSCRIFNLARARTGTAALEFALVAPVLFLLVLGIFQLGITLNNYQMVTGAARSAARQFALSRGTGTPKTDTVNQVYGSAPTLTPASFTITMSVNGVPCATDPSCQTALSTTQGQPAAVTVSYPCSLVIYGRDYAPNCNLVSTTTERIE
jgi:Flp pilus assembly protein TadG